MQVAAEASDDNPEDKTSASSKRSAPSKVRNYVCSMLSTYHLQSATEGTKQLEIDISSAEETTNGQGMAPIAGKGGQAVCSDFFV